MTAGSAGEDVEDPPNDAEGGRDADGPTSLPAALYADRSDTRVVAVVGAGGKKSLLYALAERLERAVVTATVRIPPPGESVAQVVTDEDPVAGLDRVDDWPAAVIRPPEPDKPDRHPGYDRAAVARLATDERVGTVLVKADGARTRWLKAPDEHEPRLPDADVVVPVASARVVGEPLDDERVHRPGRVAAITGRSVGEAVTAGDVGRVLGHPDGGRKDVASVATATGDGRPRVVPLVNMVDTPALAATAREVARAAHETAAELPRAAARPGGEGQRGDGASAGDAGDGVTGGAGIDRVALTRLIADEPLVGTE